MRSFPAAAAAAVFALCALTAGHAGANPADKADENNVAIGVGIICNTPEQMQRLVGLRIDGAEVDQAVGVVNGEARDPRACGVAAVAFVSDSMVDMKNVQGKLVQIMRISVVAAYDGRQWAPIPEMTQYALMEPEGYAI